VAVVACFKVLNIARQEEETQYEHQPW
jgi:hypothetical protein